MGNLALNIHGRQLWLVCSVHHKDRITVDDHTVQYRARRVICHKLF